MMRGYRAPSWWCADPYRPNPHPTPPRQVFVLATTVISMIFLAAGFYQILESSALLGGAQYSFQKAVYYAAITVIGRPGVPFVSTLTPVFLTVAALMSATIIPTFVAELIRVWYDNATLETYAGAPDLRHVIVCGDTNVSRLRALADQYLHKARDPDTVTPLVVMGDAKPEGALRVFVDQYKHSGQVVYIRGSARRAADLRRAGLARAKCVIVLNYRSDKDAAAADTEALSTVMAVKNARPEIRVLAQLQVRGRSRRRRTGCSCRATARRAASVRSSSSRSTASSARGRRRGAFSRRPKNSRPGSSSALRSNMPRRWCFRRSACWCNWPAFSVRAAAVCSISNCC